MTVVFADTSVLARGYLADEEDHAAWRELLFERPEPVVICAVAEVELPAAVARAVRGGRLQAAAAPGVLAQFAADRADDGPLATLVWDAALFERAARMVVEHPLRSLDALHVAAAEAFRSVADEPVTFASRNEIQAQAAAALGFAVI